MRESFEQSFVGIVEAFFGIGEDKNRGNHQQVLTNGPANATLWAWELFGLAELGYGDGEHRESHDGDHGQG